jgi:hypothetical protein
LVIVINVICLWKLWSKELKENDYGVLAQTKVIKKIVRPNLVLKWNSLYINTRN